MLFLFISITTFLFSTTLQEAYNNAQPQQGYDKYIVLEENAIYTGGIGSITHIKEAFRYNISGVSGGSFFIFYGPYKAVLISYPHEEFERL